MWAVEVTLLLFVELKESEAVNVASLELTKYWLVSIIGRVVLEAPKRLDSVDWGNVELDICRTEDTDVETGPTVNEEDCTSLEAEGLAVKVSDFIAVNGHQVTYSVITPSIVFVAVET